MALPYKKWTDEEIKDRNIVAEGRYPFEIISAILKKTKPGFDKDGQPKAIHDMLEVDFQFWDLDGVVRKTKDWIVFIEGMDWKLRHLANATDTLELYDNDALEAHHLGKKKGMFDMGIKEMTGNDGVKKKVNFIKDYVKKTVAEVANSAKFVDDDIPL